MSKDKSLSAQGAGGLPVIDWALCVNLANNKEELAQELLLMVIQHLPKDLAAIQQAQETKNYMELGRAVHKLHGALCYCGLPRLKNVVENLEGLLKKKLFDGEETAQLFATLEQEVKQALSTKLPF